MPRGIPPVQINCFRCGKAVRIWKCEQRAGRKSCSLLCARQNIRFRRKRVRVWIECASCSKPIEASPAELRHGKRYCSRPCAGRGAANSPAPVFGNKYAFKGDSASRWAMHKRASKLKPPSPCERCGGPGQVVHHKDENPWNNAIENLERLCRPCHARHHRIEQRKESVNV